MTRQRKQIKNGSFIGACKIVGLIGRGSIGETYEARDTLLDRHAVVKVVSPFIENSEEVVRKFKTTGQALARINHPNIATVYSLKQADNIHYIIMEFVEGRSLKDIIKRENSLEPGLAVKCFRQILEGVKCLHDAGILHQDIKPRNIIVRNDNFVKVVDFGIGRIDGQEVVSTVYYLAPEVIAGGAGSIQSDIWSLGVTLYETLTGEKPFLADDWAGVLKKINDEPLRFSESAQANLPHALQNIILKMCEKAAPLRYQNVSEILEELRSLEAIGNLTIPATLNIPLSMDSQRMDSQRMDSQRMDSQREISIGSSYPRTHESVPHIAVPIKRKSLKSYAPIIPGLAFLIGVGFWFLHQGGPNGEIATTTEKAATESAGTPTDGEKIFLKGSESLKFTWSQPARGGIYIEIAKDSEFKNLILRETFRGSPFSPSTPLKEGTYHWRLIDQSATPPKNLLEPIAFSVKTDTAPQAMFPSDKYVSQELKPVQFFWLNKFETEMYRLQVSASPTFDKLTYDMVVNGIQSERLTLAAGDYYWRVRAEDNPASISEWSAPRSFRLPGSAAVEDLKLAEEKSTMEPSAPAGPASPASVAVREPLKTSRKPAAAVPPVKSAPAKNARKTPAAPAPAIAKHALSKKEQAREKKVALAKAKKPGVRKITLDFDAPAPAKAPAPAPAAAPKRKVASIEGAIGAAGPALKMPPNGVSIVALNGTQDPISFRWEAKDGGSYRLQISTNANFSKLEANITTTEIPYLYSKKLPEGSIFWRVRKEGGTPSQWSSTYTLEVSH